jgi:STE24 endopeptidase
MSSRQRAARLLLILALCAAPLLGQGAAPAAPAVPDVTPAAGSSAAPAVQPPAHDPYTVVVTDEMRSHQRWVDTLYFVSALWGFLVLLAVLALGVSRRVRDLAARMTPRPFLAAMLFVAILSVVTTVLSFPIDLVQGYLVPHRFALSDQSLPSWLWDQTKGLLVGIVLSAPLTALALVAIGRFKRWWLAVWLGTAPVMVFLVLVGPVLLDPVFNSFKPLADEKLKTEILDLASRAGISGGRVYQVDKSKQTKTMNAYVNGLGPTKRIVLWDTIIAKMDHEELSFVMAHEMGHYVMHHVWKILGILLVIAAGVLWLGQRIVEWATRRWGRGWGFEVPNDPAAVPLLLLVVSLIFFMLTPLINGVSRHFEEQSDTFALELTHSNDAGARAFVKFAEDSKVLPDPHPLIRFWRYSHPTLAERVAFCRSYKPWLEGKPNRLWRGAPAS